MIPQTTARAGRSSYADIAFDVITERIFSRALEPGDWIRIDALATELEMSITPVREALARTTALGLATADANRGFRVAPLLTKDEFHQLFAARRALEVAAVRGSDKKVAAWLEAVDAADVHRLRSVVSEMGALGPLDAYEEYSKFSRLDRELHSVLVQMAGNGFLATAWESLHFHLHVSRLYGHLGVIDFQQAHAEHVRIVEALEARDGADLVKVCDQHINRAERQLAALLD